MYTIISHLFQNAKGAIKLLSTENGHIKLQTLDDVKIYAHTQGIFFFSYKRKEQHAEYYIKLAELMRGEKRNRWAANCYIRALEEAWCTYHNAALEGVCDDENKSIDPYYIYEIARLHLLEIDCTQGVKRLKEAHFRCRCYASLELKHTINTIRCKREQRIEKIIERALIIR